MSGRINLSYLSLQDFDIHLLENQQQSDSMPQRCSSGRKALSDQWDWIEIRNTVQKCFHLYASDGMKNSFTYLTSEKWARLSANVRAASTHYNKYEFSSFTYLCLNCRGLRCTFMCSISIKFKWDRGKRAQQTLKTFQGWDLWRKMPTLTCLTAGVFT